MQYKCFVNEEHKSNTHISSIYKLLRIQSLAGELKTFYILYFVKLSYEFKLTFI